MAKKLVFSIEVKQKFDLLAMLAAQIKYPIIVIKRGKPEGYLSPSEFALNYNLNEPTQEYLLMLNETLKDILPLLPAEGSVISDENKVKIAEVFAKKLKPVKKEVPDGAPDTFLINNEYAADFAERKKLNARQAGPQVSIKAFNAYMDSLGFTKDSSMRANARFTVARTNGFDENGQLNQEGKDLCNRIVINNSVKNYAAANNLVAISQTDRHEAEIETLLKYAICQAYHNGAENIDEAIAKMSALVVVLPGQRGTSISVHLTPTACEMGVDKALNKKIPGVRSPKELNANDELRKFFTKGYALPFGVKEPTKAEIYEASKKWVLKQLAKEKAASASERRE